MTEDRLNSMDGGGLFPRLQERYGVRDGDGTEAAARPRAVSFVQADEVAAAAANAAAPPATLQRAGTRERLQRAAGKLNAALAFKRCGP